ncbi:MAG: GHKL domain-containing protein [Eubacteriales bacterium]|nr:GHKL domain-containing protein [Eubacteriales bacterium]
MELVIAVSQIMKFFLPSFFSILFRINGLGAKSRKNTASGLLIFTLLSLVVPLAVTVHWGYEFFKQVSVGFLLAANTAIFLISSDGFLKTCYLHLLQANIVFWVSTVSGALRRMFNISYPLNALLLLAVCAVCYVLAVRYAVRPLRFVVDNVRSGWLTLLAFPSCTLAGGILIALYIGNSPYHDEQMMLLLITLLELSFVLYLTGFYRSMRQIAELERERGRERMLEAELASYDDYLQSARQTRHDLHHHNAVLLEYLNTGNTQQAVAYLESVDAQLAESGQKQFCKNPAANAILRIYDRRAQERNIAFAARMDIPEELALTMPEWGTMLSNLLENAVEACAGLPAAQRCISITARAEACGWKLEMRNGLSGVVKFENGMPLTTKTVGGTGTRSIADTVKKHGGILRFVQNKDVFVTQIVLPIEAVEPIAQGG